METIEILKAVRSIIDTPGKWIKGNMAVTATGAPVVYSNLDACKFCLVGAIYRARDDLMSEDMSHSIQDIFTPIATVLQCECKFDSVSQFNDAATTTHNDVMIVIDKAIDLCSLTSS